MADCLDFRLSTKMHMKINVFMGFLPKYTGMCRSILLLYLGIFMSVALIVLEIFAFLLGTLLLLIPYKFSLIPSVQRELCNDKVNIFKFCQAIRMIFVLKCRLSYANSRVLLFWQKLVQNFVKLKAYRNVNIEVIWLISWIFGYLQRCI